MFLRLLTFYGAFTLLPAVAVAAELIPLDADWRYLRGLSEASSPDPTAWRGAGFNDASWSTDTAPFWYGQVQPTPGTELTDMRGSYTSVFLRRTFTIDRLEDVSELELTAGSDDGFVAWVNGFEVARFNMPGGEVAFNGTSLGALQETSPWPTLETYSVASPRDILIEGGNVLAIQAFNTSLSGSSDFVINAALTARVDDVPPVVVQEIPSANAIVPSLSQIEVRFSEGVTGVDAADLVVNGTPASDVFAFTDAQYLFTFPPPAVGVVQVAWGADHRITDLSSLANNFADGSWSYTLDPDFVPPQLLINEFMASNDRTLNDPFGDDSDWIELYNPGAEPIDLNGWFLTDTAGDLTRWRFPQVTIDAQGFLLLYASGRDLKDPLQPLHTSFALDKDQGYLALVDPWTNVVSDYAPVYPPQQTDVSYGLDQSNPTLRGYFALPTPGGPNAVGGAGFAPEIFFSASSRTFANPFALGLSLATPMTNAVIRYTLDGSEVTEFSTPYGGPLTVTTTTQVRARAYADGMLPGPSVTQIYVALDASVLNYTSELPLLILHNGGGGAVPASVDQPVMLQAFEPLYGVSSLTNAPDLASRAVFHLRGSSTLGYRKGSFFLETQDESGFGRDLALLGLPKESDWVLYAPNNFEPVLINNAMAHELSREMGEYSPRTGFAVVFLNTSGGAVTMDDYNGIYVLEEKIKVDKNRVAIDRLQPEHVQPPEVTGGYLLSVDRSDPGTSPMSAGGQSLNHLSPKYAEIITPQRAPQRQYIRDYLNAFYSALTGPSWKDPQLGYAAYLDVDAAINHHIQGVVTFNVDALRLSAFLYKPRNGKLVMGPVWDFDRTQGSTDGRDFNPTVWQSRVGDRGTDMFNPDSTYSNPWYSRLFQDIDFWQRWVDRYEELRAGVLSDVNVHGLIDTFAGQVRQEQPREVNRWGVRPRSGTQTRDGYSHTFSGTYQGEVDWVKQWYSDRLSFIDGNLLPRPGLSRPGGAVDAGTTVTLSGPAGATLYYTLDGTDPRASGGGVAALAQVYAGPIQVTANARLVARAYDAGHSNETGPDAPPLSTPWSGAVAATYVVTTPALVISELMYHPAATAEDGTNTAEAFEYVEILNRGGVSLSLTGFRFTNGIEYVFAPTSGVTSLAPGARAVLVKNAAAFASRYPGVDSVAGEYTGSLENGGERLTLVGPLGEPIHDFRYEDGWHRITDGFGFSLVPVDESGGLSLWGQASGWRASSVWGGSPGAADPVPSGIPPVWVNEALTHTDPPQLDSVELYNSAAVPADISGWWLTDDLDQPYKFQVPGGTVVGAGGYLVFTEREFTNATASSFRLSSLGDEIYLFSSDGSTNLTGRLHGAEYGAAENGVAFGLYRTSTGEEHFVAQTVNTLGTANAGPRVGPLVINEIMFHPAPFFSTNNNTRDEFIELRNLSDEVLPLFDPDATTNTWRFRGGVDYDFPPGLTVPAGGYVLLTGFDPAQRPLELEAFRTRYGLDGQAVILGPYEGVLENSGETLRLLKPDPPQPDLSPTPGYVPYVLVDAVTYGNVAPWPTNANATGRSLQRIDSGAYGNDPINWHTEDATPGALNIGSGSSDSDGDGLPNDWETAHGLNPNRGTGEDGATGDPDGDGLSNYEEYMSGTHPNDPDDYLHVTSVSPRDSTVELRFRAIAGRTYSVVARESLVTGSWTRLVDVPAQTSDGEVAVSDPDSLGGVTRFYRLVTPAWP